MREKSTPYIEAKETEVPHDTEHVKPTLEFARPWEAGSRHWH
jgi:hypothetical protein